MSLREALGRRPAPTAAEVSAMRVALAHGSPTHRELLALLDSLARPASDGGFSQDAFTRIDRLVVRLDHAYATVRAVERHSILRGNVLAYIADVRALLRNLRQVGASTDPAHARRLHSKAATLHARAESAYRAIGHALDLPAEVKARRPKP